MTKKNRKPTKHIPQRTCVGCREVLPKRSLIRIVKTPEGVQVDLSGKMQGRGAYLHNLHSCWERGLKGPIENALKSKLSKKDNELLADFLNNLREDS